MGFNQAARDTAARWTMRNTFRMRPAEQQDRSPASPSDDLAKRLAELVRSLPPGATTKPPGGNLGGPYTYQQTAINIECAAGEFRAASYGPLPAPWRLASLSMGGFAVVATVYMGFTATDGDRTGLVTATDGADLIATTNSYGVTAAPTPPLFPIGNTALGTVMIIPDRGAWQASGTYLTAWWDARLSALTVQQIFCASLEIARGATITPGPDITVIRAKPPSPAGPPTIGLPSAIPSAVRITAAGYSRIIPWALLDPAIKREYLVNAAVGKPTTGLEPL